MTGAFVDLTMFLIGILVTYFMYLAVNMIHYFAEKGRLPKEYNRKRLKCCIITFIIVVFVLFSAYLALITIFYNNRQREFVYHCNMVFVLIRASGLIMSNILLSITIYKLKSAKVEVKESGHLKLFDICILLVMQIATIFAGLISFFFFNKTEKGMIYTDASRDVLEFFLAIFYFKVIIHFIKDFRLETKVN